MMCGSGDTSKETIMTLRNILTLQLAQRPAMLDAVSDARHTQNNAVDFPRTTQQHSKRLVYYSSVFIPSLVLISWFLCMLSVLSASSMQAPPNKACTNMDEVHLWQKRTEQLAKFAELLGSKSASGPSSLTSTARAKALRNLLSDSLQDHDVVLTLPSLDLDITDSEDESNNPLPGLGEHRVRLTESPQDDSRPTMAASVLTSAAEGAANSELKAAQNIGKLTSWTKSTLDYASDAVQKNLSSSFGALVDSRVRAWTLLLLRHSLLTGDAESRSGLMSMLSSIIKLYAAETSFKTLSLPQSASEQAKDSSDVVLPLLFEVEMNAMVQDKKESVTLRAPGTITAQFDDPSSFRLKSVAVRLTSTALLNSMVEQARMIVLKTVAKATKTPVPTPDMPASSPNPAASLASVQALPGQSLAGFRSALNSTPPSSVSSKSEDDFSPNLQKARNSALRLSSVLHHNRTTGPAFSANLGIRKTRSVRWDTPFQPPKMGAALSPSPKKPRKAENAARLKSFKSFGRPHAGDFGSGPRNATFAEGFDQSRYWGRKGRLVHHPEPMQSTNPNDMLGLTNVASRNATFDFSIASRRPAALPTVSEQPQQMPRTTTALEMLLLTKSTSGGKAPSALG